MNRVANKWIAAAIVAALACGVCGVGVVAANDKTDAENLNGAHVLKEKKVRINADNSVVRSGPGNTFSIVGIYEKGAEFVVIAKRDDWYNVRLSDTITGWIHSSLCDEFDDMSDLEFRPNPKLFSRVGTFGLTAYTGGYSFDRKSNSLVLGGRLGYHLIEYVTVEGNVSWTHVNRPAEIVESLFNLALEEEDFDMLFYSLNLNVILLPGRQMVPFITGGVGSTIMQGETETSINYGIGSNFFLQQKMAFRFEFRNYAFESGTADAKRENQNFEFSVGLTFYL
jgi:outer membrane beta-barrel protein